ncbi:MAG: carboxypeptidase-like regulatory domain-containing protein [Candidatus Riflebacteria bacterium]|nr:carboxypeptidase-like regulatory domain-containing protein [Candidatus Riflebacteria bacterium]
MQIRFTKVCLASLLMIYAVIFTGCSNDSQKVLILDKNEPIEGLRASLSATKQSDLLTPLSNAVNLKTFNAQLSKTSASVRFELPGETPLPGGEEESSIQTPTESWSIDFTDLNNRSWTLTIPANGVVYETSDRAQINASIYFGTTSASGGLNVIFYMVKEAGYEWVIDDISAEEILSVTTGITGRVTSSADGSAIADAIVTAYPAPYVSGDTPAGTTQTNDEGYYELFLSSGNYIVLIAHDDFTYHEELVTVD